MEVLVVDNAAPQGAVPAAVDGLTALRVIRNPQNRGFAEACNQGINASTGELVLLLNDDTILEPGALGALADALATHTSWGACQAKLLLMDDPSRLDSGGSFLTRSGFLVHRGLHEPETRYTEPDEIFSAKGAAFVVRRRALATSGTFDPDFFAYFEESDLCWRLWLAGWEVGFAPGARVLHRVGATSSGLPSPFVQFHSFKNRLCTILKNAGPRQLTVMVPCHLALCLGLAGWYAARGQPGLAGAILRAIGWNVAELPRTLGKRRRIQARRRVGDDELMPRIMRETSMRTLASYARAVRR